ncbi:MAG: DUF4412 domain-containing protein [Deltaproteobacteria bacterium]|nr:DUF4412 domain-containing protein [Deltaproteobacteria bacterium]
MLMKSAAFATSLLVSASAFAKGVVIEMSHTRDKNPTESSKVSLDGQRCRVDAQDHQVIFRGDKGVMWVIEPNKETYMEITKEDIKKAGEAMSSAMAQMQSQMAALPPEQRKMMEQMMAARGMPKGAPGEDAKVEYKANGKSETVNGFSTKGFDSMRSGKREAELWVADWKSIELRQDDFKCFEMIADMLKSMPGANRANMPFKERFGEGGLPGVPVRTVRTNAAGTFTEELKKVSRVELAADTFEAPKGRKKESMADMMKNHQMPPVPQQ